MQYSYDPATPRGTVRIYIGDAPDDVTTALIGPRTGWKCLLADEEIDAALTTRNQSPLEAASDCLLMMASSGAIIETMIRIGDLIQDPKGIATQLRTQSAALLQQAMMMPAEALVEPYGTQFQTREHLLRGLLAAIPGWEGL